MDCIGLKGFRNWDIKKMLTVLDETYDGRLSFREQMNKYFNSRWYDRYEYQYKRGEGNQKIAFYSDFYYRKDHLDIFTGFIKEFPEFDYVIPIRLLKEKRNIKRGFRMLKWDTNNFWRLRRIRMPFKKRLFFVRILGLAQLYYLNMEKYLMENNYLYGLVYNDSNPYENVLVQLMKQKELRTATMQHGIFDKHGFWKGLEFRTSVADDFLAWNTYTKELAMECDMAEEKIKVLGIPRYIYPVKLKEKTKKGIFCVVLGNKKLNEENCQMIAFANELAKNQNLKYFLRCHPTCKESDYDALIDEQLCLKGRGRDELVYQMCEQSDFCIVGSGTSMVIDLIYLGQPFLQYYEKWDGKEYQGRENYFRNCEELGTQALTEVMMPKEQVFSYYCTTTEVKSSYAQYFNSLC